MIDITVPETGAQPRDLVLEVITDTFDAAMELAEPSARPPQLKPSIELARAAQEREDFLDLDKQLQAISVAAIATRVRIRAAVEDHDPS